MVARLAATGLAVVVTAIVVGVAEVAAAATAAEQPRSTSVAGSQLRSCRACTEGLLRRQPDAVQRHGCRKQLQLVGPTALRACRYSLEAALSVRSAAQIR